MSSAEADETHRHRVADCKDCKREWDGSAVEAVGREHASTYDHKVVVVEKVVFAGSKND